MEWLKLNALLLCHIRGLVFPSVAWVQCHQVILLWKSLVLYEWLLYLSKASIFSPVCLISPLQHPDFLFLHPLPLRLSHLSAQITLSFLLCQSWQIISHSNSLNRQWHFLRCGCIFLFQELLVSTLHSLCHLHQLYLPCLLLFCLNLPHCPSSASSAPWVIATKPSSAHFTGTFLCNFLLLLPPNLVSLSLLSTIWTA